MITGSIKTHEEPKRYNNYQYGMLGGHSDYEGSYQHQAPPFNEQPAILEEAVDTAALLGFKVGARVKRRNGISNLGTIIHIHKWFSQAYNFSTGELEPFKVTWDSKAGTQGGTFDYSIADLEVVPVETPTNSEQNKEQFHEGLPHLCQSC